VLVLQPGAYTVHATTAGPAIRGGSVLVEIYSLPDESGSEAHGPNPAQKSVPGASGRSA
jgi:hypothetical protein